MCTKVCMYETFTTAKHMISFLDLYNSTFQYIHILPWLTYFQGKTLCWNRFLVAFCLCIVHVPFLFNVIFYISLCRTYFQSKITFVSSYKIWRLSCTDQEKLTIFNAHYYSYRIVILYVQLSISSV